MKRRVVLSLAVLVVLTIAFSACNKDKLPRDDWEENMEDLPSDFNEKLYGSETPWESELSQKG